MTAAHPGWGPEERRQPEHVAAVVREWIDACDSPLYVKFAVECAEDPQMLELIARIDNVPPMNLLFGAVKMALTPADAVAAWYPHLAGAGVRQPDDEAYAAFRAFALEHAELVAHVGASRRTQTNEVGRAAAMLPWIASAAVRSVASNAKSA